jgi:predicted DNA-binding protein (MmcQ/YjbR family)
VARAASSKTKTAEAALREYALSFPEAHEDFPWGERVVKVRTKVFVFMGCDTKIHALGITAKLPLSGARALEMPFTEPTGYGLAKSGWVSARFAEGDEVPVELLKQWIDESYRAVAPKKLIAGLEEKELEQAKPRKLPKKA